MAPRLLRPTLVALTALLPAAALAAEPVGFVAAVRGFAEMRGSEGAFSMVRIDRDVAVGDVVRTGPEGWLKLLLADDTTLAVDAGSELRLDRFAAGDGSSVTLWGGHLRAKLGDAQPHSHLRITSGRARVEARDAEWLVWHENDATWVCAVAGTVTVRVEDASLDLGGGECARAATGVEKAARPGHLRAVAMRPGEVKDRAEFPARATPAIDGQLRQSDPIVIDVNDLIRRPADTSDGRPPANAAVP